MSHELPELVERVAEHALDDQTFNMEQHDWEKGCAINGLHAVGLHEEETRYLVDRSIETQTTEGQLTYGSLGLTPYGWEPDWAGDKNDYKSYADPVVPGHGVLELYDRTGDDYYLDAAQKQYEQLQSIEKTEGGGIPISRGEKELLLDSLYHISPFMARYGELADDPEAIDEAVHQIEVHAERCYDPHTGLYRQGWQETPNSFAQDTFWSRGVAWLTTAIVATLPYVPEDHEGYDDLVEMLQDVSEVVLDYQDDSGFWHNTLDDRTSPLEASGTMMFVYTFEEGMEQGVLDQSTFEEPSQRAMDVCKGLVDSQGGVRRVAVVPGGPDAPLGVALHGQGFFLLAASYFL
ncbi:glycoside hydrolase family 88 protein [Halobacterium wangiae]|uniref:glycoside hydrolase family 88 protein n=1 Tax=Halobacterium wangiae TaxID=2902623 RepID=UPI001E657F1A|nr:glycoside hydrolase family 88 protein [Halobacterium wangiae]